MTRKRNAAAQRAWDNSQHPIWLNEEHYRKDIQPHLSSIEPRRLMSTLNVSHGYANDIRLGRRPPHPRYWLALARLLGTTESAVC